MQPSWKSLAGFPFQNPLKLLILVIWPSSPFQLFGCPPSLSFFPNSWTLLLLGWKFPSTCFYLRFPHSWFLVVLLLYSWIFALYFLIPYCMTGRLRPICPSQSLWSYLGCVVCPRDPRALAFSTILAQSSLLGFFWLTDFDRLGLSFASWNLKHFPFMGLWIPILWTSHPFLLSFFLSSLQDNPMCYFSLGLRLWLILNLNRGLAKWIESKFGKNRV